MIRLCSKNHLTADRTCWCGKPAEAELGGRVKPKPLHPRSPGAIKLRNIRIAHRQGSCVYGKFVSKDFLTRGFGI